MNNSTKLLTKTNINVWSRNTEDTFAVTNFAIPGHNEIQNGDVQNIAAIYIIL